jgi:hypothetical protein
MVMEEKLGTMWMKGMEDVPLVKKKGFCFQLGSAT